MLFSVYHSQRFSLLINSLINFDLELSQRLGLRFYRSLMLCWSPLHAHFSTIKHLLLALLFKKKYAKFSSIIAWKRETFKSVYYNREKREGLMKRDCERNFKWLLIYRMACQIYNGTLQIFVWWRIHELSSIFFLKVDYFLCISAPGTV